MNYSTKKGRKGFALVLQEVIIVRGRSITERKMGVNYRPNWHTIMAPKMI